MLRWSIGVVLFAVVSLLSMRAEAVLRDWDDEGATSDWSDAANWTDDGVPETIDDVSIGALPAAVDDTVIFDLNGDTVASLLLTEGADLDTDGGRLVMTGIAAIGTGTASGTTRSELIVRPRAGIAQFAIDTNALTVGANGRLTILDSEVDVDGTGLQDGVLEIADGGELVGYGLVELSDNDASLGGVTSLLVNDGSITVANPMAATGEPPSVTLAITAPNAPINGQLNLGGVSGMGLITVSRNATLELGTVFSGPQELTLFANSTLRMNADGALSAGSTLEVNSGRINPGGPNELPQAPAVITGSGVLATEGVIRINRADEELIVNTRIDGVAGTVTNRGIVRFRGGGGIRGITFNTLDDGVIYNESSAVLNFQGGNTYNTPLINEGLMGVLPNGSATATIGELTQTAAGTLAIDLGGILADDFDVLNVEGDAALAGTLSVVLEGGFQPTLGNTFEILTTVNGVITGEFDTLNFPTLSGLEFDISYNSQSVELQVISSGNGTQGDFDMDEDVDGLDFLKWQQDGLSASELTDWQANYGPGPLSGIFATVPEPATCASVALAIAASLLTRSRAFREIP